MDITQGSGQQTIGLVHALYQPGYSAWHICPRIRQRKGCHLLRLRKRYWDCWVHGLLVRPMSSAGHGGSIAQSQAKGGGSRCAILRNLNYRWAISSQSEDNVWCCVDAVPDGSFLGQDSAAQSCACSATLSWRGNRPLTPQFGQTWSETMTMGDKYFLFVV